jgi:hypothetical protein
MYESLVIRLITTSPNEKDGTNRYTYFNFSLMSFVEGIIDMIMVAMSRIAPEKIYTFSMVFWAELALENRKDTQYVNVMILEAYSNDANKNTPDASPVSVLTSKIANIAIPQRVGGRKLIKSHTKLAVQYAVVETPEIICRCFDALSRS